jgi:hypothetical protein
LDPNFQSDFDLKTFVWTFVDSDASRDGVPDDLIFHGTRLFAVYVTSPAKERWSRMDKVVNRIVVVMDPWTKAEIRYA